MRGQQDQPPTRDGAPPDLSGAEHKQIERRAAPRAAVVYETIRREGEDELRRPSAALAWSGLAAGLSMGFSLVTEGLVRSMLPDAPEDA
jgi:formate/nitrite transporter FocA (FNT family)